MAHQIIHTSCKRGISNQSDGFQVYSFNEKYKPEIPLNNQGDVYLTPEYLKHGNYEAPNNIILDEDTIHLAPKEFAYEVLKENNKRIFVNRIPCKDYAKEWARWGNVFKHFIICTPEEVTTYPCEYYRSPMLREGLTPEEASAENPPSYLPDPILSSGSTISVEFVLEFLSSNDSNRGILRKMVFALLHSDNGDKKIVICDTQNAIPLWIAAIEFVLPLELAKSISFTTYTKNPEFSDYWICGTVPEGANFNSKDPMARERMYVFDMTQHIYSEIGDTEGSLYELIETPLPNTYDKLREFHSYLNNFEKVGINSDYAALYSLFELETFGFTNLDNLNLNIAFSYLERAYGGSKRYQEYVLELLKYPVEISRLDNPRYLTVLSFIRKAIPNLPSDAVSGLKSIILNKIITSFIDQSITKEEFEAISSTSSEISIEEVQNRLTLKENLETLSSVLVNDVPFWKIEYLSELFFYTVITQTSRDANILEKGSWIEHLYSLLFNACEKQYNSIYGNFVANILMKFESRKDIFLSITLLISDISNLDLLDRQNVQIWDLCNQRIAVSWDETAIRNIYSELQQKRLYGQLFNLYLKRLHYAKSDVDLWNILIYHINFNIQNEDCKTEYLEKSINAIWNVIDVVPGDNKLTLKKNLLNLYSKYGIVVPAEGLERLSSLYRDIPFASLSEANKNLIVMLRNNYLKINAPSIPAKLGLLYIGNKLEDEAHKAKDTKESIQNLIIPSSKELSRLAPQNSDDFLEWILPSIKCLLKDADDMKHFYSMFVFSEFETELIATYLTNEYYKPADSGIFLEYIAFIAKIKDEDAKKIFEKKLVKTISKKDLESLDVQICAKYNKNTIVYNYWKYLEEEIGTSGILSKTLFNPFKRHKKE